MLQETMFAMDMSVCVDYEIARVADYWRCFNNGKERDIFSILRPHDRSLWSSDSRNEKNKLLAHGVLFNGSW